MKKGGLSVQSGIVSALIAFPIILIINAMVVSFATDQGLSSTNITVAVIISLLGTVLLAGPRQSE